MQPLVPYDKTVWRNDDTPDIDAEHLAKLEQGVYDATKGVNDVLGEAMQAKGDAASVLDLLDQHIADHNNPHGVTAAQVGASSGGSGGGGGGLGTNVVARGARGDGATDNTPVLQACLDELRTAGGGSLLIPRDANNHTYRTRCLWVPSNVSIISDGATLENIGWSSDTRYASWDGDQIAAAGLFSIYPQTKYGFTAPPEFIHIEGVRLSVSSARTDGILTYGIDCGGSYVRMERLIIVGDPKDCINFGERRGQPLRGNHVDKSYMSGARRNIVSIEGADIRHLWITNSFLYACSGVPTPVGGGTMDNSPGAGIDIEQPSAGGSLAYIHVLDNHIGDNAGPGIACSFIIEPGDTLDGIEFRGNRIHDNSRNPQGGLYGGIWLAAGKTSNTLRIISNTIEDSRQGAGVQGQPVAAARWRHKTLIALNEFHGNAGGDTSVTGVGQTISIVNNI